MHYTYLINLVTLFFYENTPTIIIYFEQLLYSKIKECLSDATQGGDSRRPSTKKAPPSEGAFLCVGPSRLASCIAQRPAGTGPNKKNSYT